MTTDRAALKNVGTTVLTALREAIASGLLRTPIDRASLVGFGIRHQLEAIEHALAGHRTAACLAVLDVALAEREDRRPTPELVWTGPGVPAGTARDTAVVLRSLFEGGQVWRREGAGERGAPFHPSPEAQPVTSCIQPWVSGASPC